MTNAEIAQVLLNEARTLTGRASALYRIRAYRQAAAWIAMYPRELAEVLAREGRAGLERVPGVGSHLAITLESLLTTGEVRHITAESAHREPRRLVTSLPGIGTLIAARLRDEARVETVADLAAALENQDRALPGIGRRRRAALREALDEREREPIAPPDEPDVIDLLAVDAVFRDQIGDEEPLFVRSFTWARAGFRYRVDLDRSALAYQLDRVGDRVVIHFSNGEQAGEQAGERLVETESEGDLAGHRVVRGREEECRRRLAVRA